MAIFKEHLGTENGTLTVIAAVPETMRIGVQNSMPYVWYEEGPEEVEIVTVFTGYEPPDNGEFVGFVIDDRRGKVYHYYRVNPNKPTKIDKLTPPTFSKPNYTVNHSEVPDNGLVFWYVRANGESRRVRVNHIQFWVKQGRQGMSGYDVDRHEIRSFYLDQIVAFHRVV